MRSIDRKYYRLARAALILTIAVVWGQSMIPRAYSQVESDALLYAVKPFHDIDIGNAASEEYWHFSDIIRKLAHLIEYTVVGVELQLFAFFRDRSGIGRTDAGAKDAAAVRRYELPLYGVLIGLTDETIQLFSHRGSSITDVWIDTLGVLLGVLAGIWLKRAVRGRLDRSGTRP